MCLFLSRALRRKRLLLPAAALLLLWFSWFVLPRFFALPAELLREPTGSPVLLDRHGRPIHHLTLPDFTRRTPVALAEVPPALLACTIAAEDKRFPRHPGIDLLATARSARDALRHRRTVSGASTITQQLVKLSSPPAPRTFRTKLREALVARHLEMRWSKPRILTAYLNRLDYGNRRIGPGEAARFYFQKPLSDLSLAECALLAGIPQAPSRLNPLRHPAAAQARRDRILHLLPAAAASPDAIRAALTEPLRLRPLAEPVHAPWLATAPLAAFRTTIDLTLQQDLETIVREELSPLRQAHLHHAAAVVLDNATGEVLALVSSGDWNDPRGGQINGAFLPRSPGSTLKPFTWLLAFENGGLHPGSLVADIPTRFRTLEGLDAPQNFDRTFRGPVSVRQALACSLNVPAMRALNDLGGPRPLHQLLLRLGMDSIGPDPEPYGLGLTLGNAPVRLIDLTHAYSLLARQGSPLPHGWTLTPRPAAPVPLRPPLFSGLQAYLIAEILSDPDARLPAFGRGGPLDLPFRCATKTGTSSDFRDNWCVGFTPEFTIGVWAGNFDNSPMKGLSGAAGAGPIFHRAMIRAHRDAAPTWFPRPAGLLEVRLDPRNGKRVPPGSPGPFLTELLPRDRMPLMATGRDYDEQGRALLDAGYAEWLSSEHNRRRADYALAPDLPAETPLRILAPRDGAIYVLDPELPNGGLLRLATNLPGLARWESDTLRLDSSQPEPLAELSPGRHILTATDPRGGARLQVAITVEQR